MNDLALIIALFSCIAVGWLLGIVSVPENQDVKVSQNVVEIKDCKSIKLDTISYNYRDNTYVILVKYE